MGPYTIVKMDSHTITVNEDGIHNNVSIDGARHASGSSKEVWQEDPKGSLTQDPEGKLTEDHEGRLRQQDPEGINTQPAPKESQLHIVGKIVRHVTQIRQTKYDVRRYGYTPADDTIERAHYLRQHFIERYWKQTNRSQVGQRKTRANTAKARNARRYVVKPSPRTRKTHTTNPPTSNRIAAKQRNTRREDNRRQKVLVNYNYNSHSVPPNFEVTRPGRLRTDAVENTPG